MKVVLGLCLLAILASASADCGCLKCNPQLNVVSPRYSPCKVIYRNSIRNLPSIAPYKLQAAIDPPPPLFVPKEYDYQMQYLPMATPYMPSVYEYGLQAAVPPPPEPLHIPLKNLRTGVERVVMDAPFNSVMCGRATCNPGLPAKLPAPLPVHLHHHHHHDCGCDSCECDSCNNRRNTNTYGIDFYGRDESDSCGSNSCGCDSCNRDRDSLSRRDDDDEYRGPIIEPIIPPLCRRYASNIFDNFLQNSPFMIGNDLRLNCRKFRRKRDLSGRSIIDLPMNFMFKFLPNLVRGPIVHAMHTIQHNANPAVVRARANAIKHRAQAHLAKSKYKLNLQRNRQHISPIHSKNSKQPSPLHFHPNIKNANEYPHKLATQSTLKKSFPFHSSTDPLLGTSKSSIHDEENNIPLHFLTPKLTKRSNHQHSKDNEISSFNQISTHPNLGSKYSFREKEKAAEDFVSKTNDFLNELFNTFTGKPLRTREHTSPMQRHHESLDELKNHFHNKGYSDEDIRDILLAKMKKFNEAYERHKRSVHKSNQELSKTPADTSKNRKKRSVLFDTNQFQLPFFEIEDEVLDNYNSNQDEQIVGLKHKRKRKHKRHHDDSDMDSGEEILGASHPLHDHPFVVLLRTPLKLLHHFHDIRKNFQPILYSFPKILQSSRKYLKDFGRNLQTGVLDFASHIMGDFNNQVPRRSGSLLFPSRQRRSIFEDTPTTAKKIETPHRRDKRYILKVVDEKEVQEFLEEKLGGYFDDDEEGEEDKEEKEPEESEETVGNAKGSTKDEEKKFIVKKLSPKLILDNNGKPFIEINGNKRPLFFGKNKHKPPLLQKSKLKALEEKPSNSKGKEEENDKDDDKEPKNEEMNGKIDEIIAQAKQKLRDGEILKSVHCDEMPTQTIKEKVNQISSYIQDLVSLDCSKYADLFDNLSKLEKMRKSIAEYWKKVMINEKSNDIQCKIKILKNIREMQNEKDAATKKIAAYLKVGDTFMIKKLIKLLVRLQKLQCLIQKIVDHFENRMKIGTVADTEKEIKFVDYLSSLSFESAQNEEEFVLSLKKEKHESLHREIKFLENLRLLLQKDDSYITNEVAKQIWEMRNIEKLQLEAIQEMNIKLDDNMKIRKELKILFDLLKQIEASEDACGKLLSKVGDTNVVGAKYSLRNGKRQVERPSLAEILEKIRSNTRSALAARRSSRRI